MDSKNLLLSTDIRVADDSSIVDNRAHHHHLQITTTAATLKTVNQKITATGTRSDLDLRAAKGELFSKLIEPQQMIVTPSNKIISAEDITTRANDDGLNRLQITNTGLQPQQQQQDQQGSPVALYSRVRSKWYTNEEVASILTSFESNPEWRTEELRIRPESGAVLLYSREKVRYRQDGYCWKKRKNGRTTREDHMKLKVQGVECIYGCYVHSAILPTFHRRCYWLLENPDIVLVHYLNQPADDKSKTILTFDPDVLEQDTRRRWTNEEIIEEIGAVFGGISQIHHTLSLNLPQASDAGHQPVATAVSGDQTHDNVLIPDNLGLSGSDKTMANNNNNSDNNTEIVGDEDEMDLDGRSNDGRQMDQDPCSPVTQIYNKIVDDIETCVLPLEPNQFDPNPSIQHQQHQRQQQQQQQQQQQNDHHNLSSSGISLQTMDTSDSSMASDDNHRRFEREHLGDYVNRRVMLEHQQQQPFSLEAHHRHGGPIATVGLSSCDLLGSCGLDQISDHNQVCKANDGGDILLTDYNNVTNTMEDMSDLMIDVKQSHHHHHHHQPDESHVVHDSTTPNTTTEANHQLIIGSDPLNSFLFTPCDQLDIKSTVSDIGSSHRLSPMTVPRCNSTDNALRSSSDHHSNHHHHQFHHHHHLNHYQSAVGRGNPTTNDFLEYTVGNPNNRSTASTEASNSTSCSASPSSSSLLPVRAGSYLSSVSPTNVCMKLPLQQRQNSEQKEPSNSVLNSLLPKALSLDGSDLSTSHRYNYQHYYHHNYNNNNNNNNISNNHHQHHNSSNYNHRKSPLISSYGHHSRVVHRLGNNNQQQQQQHNLAARSRQASLACADLGTHQTSQQQQQQQQQLLSSYRKLSHAKTVQILDYVPNWSPSSGGAKVLFIGDWSSLFSCTTSATATTTTTTTTTSNLQITQEQTFHVLFEDQLVPATLIQDNVLRCHTPPLKAGFISLKVLYGEIVVTEQMLFEIRADSPPTSARASTPLASMNSSSVHNHEHIAGRTDSSVVAPPPPPYLRSPIAIKMESSEEQTGQRQQQQQQQQIVSSQNMD